MAVRTALVGVGGYGRWYVNALLHDGAEHGVKLAAGIDPYADRLPYIDELRQAGVAIYPDLATFFEHDRADLVCLAAPIHLHAQMTEQALAHGAYVLCEKPVTASIAEVTRMFAAERQAGKPVAIGYQWSFSDAILAFKQDVLDGRFGRAISAKAIVLWPRGYSYYHRNTWAGAIRTAGGDWVLDSPVNNAAAHYLHNMLFVLGDTLDTSAAAAWLRPEIYRANKIENYDTAAMRIATVSGVDLLFITAHPSLGEFGPATEFVFERGVVTYPDEHGSLTARMDDGTTITYGDPNATATNKIWRAAEMVHGGAAPVCGIETALPHLECVLATHQLAGSDGTGVIEFPADLVVEREAGSDRFVYVEGLEEELVASYQQGKTPGEREAVPWAAPGEQVWVNSIPR